MTTRLLALLALAAATPAVAQFQSDSTKFLENVRDAKNDEVTQAVEKPGSRIIDTKGSNGEGALHIIVRRGDSAYLNYFLSHGADANIRDDHGTTPLLLAAETGQDGMVEPLLKAHANPNLANQGGETPLIVAVQHRDAAMIRVLLAHGANPNQRDIMAGLSARDYAARDTRSPMLVKLLDEKPDKPAGQVAGPRL